MGHPISDRVSVALLVASVIVAAVWFSGIITWDGEVLTEPVVPGNWMAWTWVGVIFFVIIAIFLILMILWAVFAPEVPRRGMLRIETTPGDRLFISLLGAAFIQIGWLGIAGPPLLGALALGLLWAAVVFRWV